MSSGTWGPLRSVEPFASIEQLSAGGNEFSLAAANHGFDRAVELSPRAGVICVLEPAG
jgi:hypothetical protein